MLLRPKLFRFRFKYQASPALKGALYYFFFFAGTGAFFPFFSSHLHELSLSSQKIGLIYALLPLMGLFVSPSISMLVDYKAWRVKTLRLGLLLMMLSALLLSQTQDFKLIFLFFALFSLMNSPVGPISNTIISQLATRHHVEFGRLRLWGSISFASSSLICGYLWRIWGYDLMFVVVAMMLSLAFLVSLSFEEPQMAAKLVQENDPQSDPKSDLESDLKSSSKSRLLKLWNSLEHKAIFLTLAASSFLIGAALYIDAVYAGMYMERLGGSSLLVGFLFATTAFAEIPGMRYVDKLLKRFGNLQSLLLAYGFIAASYIFSAFAIHPLMLILAYLIKGSGFGLWMVLTIKLIDRLAPYHIATTLQSLITVAAVASAQLIASPLAGLLASYNLRLIYLLSLLLSLAAFVLLFWRSQSFAGNS
ncbi:MAG: MFS transporter [Deinococcales bacterium]